MAAIENYQEPWENHTGLEVETFLKSRLTTIEGGQLMTIAVSIVGSQTVGFVASDETVTFKYKVNNTINGEFDANFSVKITIGNEEIVVEPTVSSADDEITSPNIAPYLALVGTDTIPVSIQAYTDNVTSAVRVIRYTRNTAILTTSNSIANTNPTELEYNATFSGVSATVEAHFYGSTGTIGGSSYVTQTKTVTVNGRVTINVPSTLEAGAHIVEAFLILADGTTKSQTVTTSFFLSTGGNDGDVYITYEPVTGASQYDTTLIKFAVYQVGLELTDTIDVHLKSLNPDTGQYDTKAVRSVRNSSEAEWLYTVLYENNQVQIDVPQKNNVVIAFTAVLANINWTAKANPTIYLSAQGRSNSDANVSQWTYGNYSMVFEDFQWDDRGAGWYEQNRLRFLGSSKAYINNFYPLYDDTVAVTGVKGGGLLAKGRTIKMAFMVTNVTEPEAKLIECWDGITGFYVTGDAIYINIGEQLNSDPKEAQYVTGHNARRFSPNTRIDLTITLQPYYDRYGRETKHELRYYINGEIAAFATLGTTTSLSQAAATKRLLTFGGVGACLHLYDFRYYEEYLTAFEVLQTRTMDLDNAIDIKNVFAKNNFYDLDGTGNPVITLTQALNYGKYLAKNGQKGFAVWVSTDLCNGQEFIGSTKVTNDTDPQSFYIYRFTTDASGNGIIDPNLSIWVEGPTGGALRMRRQGTSTAGSTKGNIRIDTRATCRVHPYDGAAGKFSAEYTEVGKNAMVWQIPDDTAIPCYLLTLKKNPNESTQARNLPTAKWYEDCCRYLATVNTSTVSGTTVYGYEDCLTWPQRRELAEIVEHWPNETRAQQVARIKTRQCVDGIPSLGFEMVRSQNPSQQQDPTTASTSFGGQFDMITDKTNMNVFGFGGYNHVTNDGGREFVPLSQDNDFSIEWRQNQSAVCTFHSTDLRRAGVKAMDGTDGTAELEYRYPDMDTRFGTTIGLEEGGVMQKFFDFVYNCSPHNINFTSTNGEVTANGGVITIKGESGTFPDTALNRRVKFTREVSDYMVLNLFLFNGIAIDRGLMCDQDVKNQFFTNFTGENNGSGQPILRLLGYDFDSSWSMDNDGYFRFLYTVLYSDGLYDGRESGRGSDLWELIFACFPNETKEMVRHLYRGGLLTANGVLNYMHTNQVSVYNAMHYNANSEYSYTENSGDYEKAHGAAMEHNEWFVRGRMYFTAGSTFQVDDGSDFAAGVAYFNVSSYDSLNAINKYNNQYDTEGAIRRWAITVTAFQRSFVYLRVDTEVHNGGMIEVTTTYDEHGMPISTTYPETTLRLNRDIYGSSDTRFYIYGGRFIRAIADLSHWYISRINQWGDLVNVEELNLGSTAVIDNGNGNTGYDQNTALNNLGITSGLVFGSCKKLNLGGCSGFSGNLDLTAFPVLEEFEGRRTNIATLSLPVGTSIKKLRLPATFTTLSLIGKPNVSEIYMENVQNLSSINVSRSSEYAAKEAINILGQLI